VYTKAVAVKTLVVEFLHPTIFLGHSVRGVVGLLFTIFSGLSFK